VHETSVDAEYASEAASSAVVMLLRMQVARGALQRAANERDEHK